MSDSGKKRWKVLSLVLLLALAVSLSINVYSAFFAEPVLKVTSAPFEFTFTWGPESQRIINGTFRLSVKMWLDGENVTMVVTANDDEFDMGDYVGLVFDTNQNGYIDHGDEPYGLFAGNKTQPSSLSEYGMLGFAQVLGRPGPHNVTFDPDLGYTFNIIFPYYWQGSLYWDPSQAIRNGTHNQLHVCYFDYAGEGNWPGNWVFTRFAFHANEVK